MWYNLSMKQKILKYDVIFEEQPDSGFTVTVPSLPGCISEGDTLEQARANITDAIKLYLEDLSADREEIPARGSNIFVGQISVSNPLIH